MAKDYEGQENKEFDDAFDAALEADPQPDNVDVEEPEKKEPEPKEPEVKKEEPAPAPPAEVIDDTPFEQKWKTLQGIYRHEKDEWLNEKERLLSELEAAKAAERQPEAKKTDDHGVKELLDSLDLTDEQKAQLAEYDEEFDVVSKMEGLKRKNEMARLKVELQEMLKGFREEFATQQKPVQEFIAETQKDREENEVKRHFQTIENAHPDFAVYRDNESIKKWIESKPGYLRKGLQEIYSTGSADDIVEMLDDFKRENGITASKPENVISMNRAKEARKQAMTPPVTKRGAVNASMSVATDFDGAFDEAINKLT